MQIGELTTPNFLVDLDLLEQNIAEMAARCRVNGKQLWPMVKTHKSTAIARKQVEAGAAGFLTGTLDEAEKLMDEGFTNLMLAYPVAAGENIERALKLGQRGRVTLSLDGAAAARQINEALRRTDGYLDYLIIIDCGLQRFGVEPGQAAWLARELASYERLYFKGIATHPGQVYGAASAEEVREVAAREVQAMQQAVNNLQENGFQPDIIATGSTPTADHVVKAAVINVLRPGNYVFYDNIQMALGVVPMERCALTVLATILSRPRQDTFIVDAGSKCLGLDKGAHGNALLDGYGRVKGHPELYVIGLSEEVGKIKIAGQTPLQVGDKIQIIPNHACSTANMTSYLVGHRKDILETTLPVDMRGGTVRRPPV